MFPFLFRSALKEGKIHPQCLYAYLHIYKDVKRVCFEVNGPPIPLRRHRLGKAGMFNPSKPAQEEFLEACRHYLPSLPLEGPLSIKLHFYLPRPKSHLRSRNKQPYLREDAPTFHTSSPDVDNLGKFVLDALNGHAYNDDRQIYKMTATKQYVKDVTCKGKTWVSIRSIETPIDHEKLNET